MSVDARGQSIPFHIVSGAPLTFAIVQPECEEAVLNGAVTATLYGRGEIPISLPAPIRTARRAEFTVDSTFTAALSEVDLYRLEVRVDGVPWIAQERVRVHRAGEARPDSGILDPITVRISQDIVARVGVTSPLGDLSGYVPVADYDALLARVEALEAGGGGATAPGAPTNLSASPGDGSVSLSWLAPASNGGAPITDYVIQSSPAGAATWTTATDSVTTETSAIVSGLTNGDELDFRVAAVNSVDTGPYSETVTEAAGTVPSAPQNFTRTD